MLLRNELDVLDRGEGGALVVLEGVRLELLTPFRRLVRVRVGVGVRVRVRVRVAVRGRVGVRVRVRVGVRVG